MPLSRGRRHLDVTGGRIARWGALALLVRPAYIATEFVVAAATTGGYSFLSDSVSRLGEVGCSAAYCSPRHELMNGSFMGFGALLVGGAVLLSRPLGPWVTGLLVVSGLSSVATGLAPLDQDATLHAIAAAVVAGTAAVSFVLSGDGPASGALHHLALWPVLVGLAGSRGPDSLPMVVQNPVIEGRVRTPGLPGDAFDHTADATDAAMPFAPPRTMRVAHFAAIGRVTGKAGPPRNRRNLDRTGVCK